VESEKAVLHHVVEQFHVVGPFHLDAGVIVHVAHLGARDQETLHGDIRCGDREHIAIAASAVNNGTSDANERERLVYGQRAFRVSALHYPNGIVRRGGG
jgi:hypothetical protein